MKELTKAEEQIMQCLWKIDKGFVKDIIEQFPDPKPAYTTVTTVIRILADKGFIKYNTYGKVNEYYPAISKSEYARARISGVIRNYFSNSSQKFTSFFAREGNLSLTELEEIKKILEEQIKEKKRKGNG